MKTRLLLLITAALVSLGLVLPQMALAAGCPTSNDPTTSKNQILIGTGATGNDCNSGGVSNIFNTAVSILSYVAGALAIIMIIVSGFRYITSGGDANKVSGAKNTLIYALVGIAVAVLAQLLVNFVITKSNDVVQCQSGQHLDASSKCVANKP